MADSKVKLNPVQQETGRFLAFAVAVMCILLQLALVPNAYGQSDPFRIMALGDSITKGYPDYSGYRRSLYQSLTGDGYYVDFVGSQTDGTQSEGSSRDFDRNHEGFNGEPAEVVRDNVIGYLSDNPADIILLHIGTNDLDPPEPELPQAPADVVAEIEQILNRIDDFEASNAVEITVLLARIINVSDPAAGIGPNITALNGLIQIMADTRIADGDKIAVVDQESVLTYPDDLLADGIHPTQAGYDKMAEAWLSALRNYLEPFTDDAGVCADSVTAYYRLNEISPYYADELGGPEADCSSCPIAIPGIAENGQEFNGIDDEVSVPDYDQFDWAINSSFSIAFWMKKTTDCRGNTGDDNEVIIGRDSELTDVHWWVGVRCNDGADSDLSGRANFTLRDRLGRKTSLTGSGTGLADGEWHHVAAVRDGAFGVNRLYLDGTLVASAYTGYIADFDDGVADVNLGWLDLGNHFRYAGALDEVAIFNRAITATEIEAHYNNGKDLGLGFCGETGLCTGVVCDDSNLCTNDVCDPSTGTCTGTPYVPDESCFLGGACAADNVASSCSAGVVTACQTGTPEASDLTCDGVDNDCNGLVDDGYVIDASCGVGACQTNNTPSSCVAGVETLCQAGTAAADDVTCDGIDDDCNGAADDGYVIDASCGVGACQTNNTPSSCVAGSETLCQAGAAAADDVTCDGIDDDCNGAVDDGYVPDESCFLGGACAAVNVASSCSAGVETACATGTPESSDLTCDGVDNDCNDLVDDGYVPDESCFLGGACAAANVASSCSAGVETACATGTPESSDLTCDGVDNDCNDLVDDAYVPDESCFLGGACAAANVASSCSAGVETACATGTPESSDLTCDGVDNDCNDLVDDGYVPDESCFLGGACAAANVASSCSAGVETACATGTPESSDLTCDGVDNDCNDLVDDGYVPDESCFLGGACAAANVASSCSAGVETACATGTPESSDLTCDGIDDDCNGLVDDGYVIDASCGVGACQTNNTPSSCVAGSETLCQAGTAAADDVTCDGIDDDCNDLVDDGYVPDESCFLGGACAAGNVASSCSAGVETACVTGRPLTCDDGNVCNGVETCDPASGCQPGTPLACDDGDLCTDDSCDAVTGCMNTPVICSQGDSCDPLDGVCKPIDLCAGVVCDDGNLCTEDSCDPATGTCIFSDETATCGVETFVTRFYQQCLNRGPDQAGLDNWVNALVGGTLTGADVAWGFVFSQEFVDLNTTNEEYLNVLYRAFFDRDPDSGGYNDWLSQLDSGVSREDVLDGFISAQEFLDLCDSYGISAFSTDPRALVEAFVTRFYRQCLKRGPEQAGLDYWVNALMDGTSTGADVAWGFVFSQEFVNLNTTNEEYLTVLYQAFFKRQPDPGGFTYWLDQFTNGASREDVLNGFIYAQEFADLCDTFGITPF